MNYNLDGANTKKRWCFLEALIFISVGINGEKSIVAIAPSYDPA